MTYPGGNGDGSLLYPRNGVAEDRYGPISSLRWELCREGIEDFDYLRIVEEIVQHCEDTGDEKQAAAGRALLDVSEVTRSFTDYTDDPRVIDAHRERLGQYIARSGWPFVRASR
jgi:hypothetical protein